jgi:hypothetical protein
VILQFVAGKNPRTMLRSQRRCRYVRSLRAAQAAQETKIFEMALHRDIYWVGRQWTVTGYGIQACDQRRKGKFDIEATTLWDEGVLESMRDLAWLDIVDFEKAIVVARKYYPEPARKVAPPEEHVLGLIAEVLRKPSRQVTGHQDIGDQDIGHVGHKDIGHKDVGHKDIDHEDTDRKDTDHKDTDHKDTDHKDTDHKDIDHQGIGLKDIDLKAMRIEESKLAAQRFELRAAAWPAKFVPQWRIRIQR